MSSKEIRQALFKGRYNQVVAQCRPANNPAIENILTREAKALALEAGETWGDLTPEEQQAFKAEALQVAVG